MSNVLRGVSVALVLSLAASATAATQDAVWMPVWTKASPLLSPRAGAASVVVGRHLYVMGGVDGTDFVATTEYTSIHEDGSLGPWQPGPRMNEPRGFFAAVTHAGYVYVIGGGQGENGHVLLRTVERARIEPDGSLSAWALEKNGMNVPRRCSKAVVVDNTIYSIGGFGGDMLDSVEHAEITDSGELEEWFEEEERLTVVRYINDVNLRADITYAIGGHDQETGGGIPDAEWTTVQDAAGYGKWQQTSPLSVGRWGLAVVDFRDRLYALGGNSGVEYLSSIESAEIKPGGGLGPWSQQSAELPMPNAMFDVERFENQIYIIGGTNHGGFLRTVAHAVFNEAGEIGSWLTAEEAHAYRSSAASHQQTAAPSLPNEGKVVQVQRVSRYVYLLVSSDQGESWIAGPAADFAPGDGVRYGNGTLMEQFYSRELDQTFPRVLFVSALERVAPSAGQATPK